MNKKYIKVNINDTLDKVASINKMTDKEFEAIEYVLKKHALDRQLEYFEKLAKEDECSVEKKELDRVEKFNKLKFVDVSNVGHGEYIKLPEVKNNEASFVPAIIFKNISGIYCLIVTSDRRYKIIKNKEDIICIKDAAGFKFEKIHHKNLKCGDKFLISQGNELRGPITLSSRDEVKEFDKVSNKLNTYFDIIRSGGDDIFSKGDLYIPVSEHELEEQDTDYVANLFEKRSAKNPGEIKRLVGGNNKATIFNSDGGVIKLSGEIEKLIRNKDEFYEVDNRLQSDIYETDEKVAFTANTITLECLDRKGALFNLAVQYRDTDKRMMNLQAQKFNRIKEGKVRAILRILRFENQRINEIIYKSKNEPRAIIPLPSNVSISDIKKIENGQLINISKEQLKKNIRVYANPADIMKNITLTTSLGLLAGAALEASPDGLGAKAKKVSDFVSKIADSSKVVSAKFEKIAMDNENEYILDMAKVNAISAIYMEKLATALNDDEEVYPGLKDVSLEIIYLKPILEKMAYDLTSVKVKTASTGNKPFSHELVSSTISNFDNLYKIAKAVYSSFDEKKLMFK